MEIEIEAQALELQSSALTALNLTGISQSKLSQRTSIPKTSLGRVVIGAMSTKQIAHLTQDDVRSVVGGFKNGLVSLEDQELDSMKLDSMSFDVSGLSEYVITELFATDTGVAMQCQRMEFLMRLASSGALTPQQSFDLPAQAHALLDTVKSLELDDFLDILAVASLKQQCALYRASRAKAKEHYCVALDAWRTVEDVIASEVLFMSDKLAGDHVIGLRLRVNAYTAAYSLDELNSETKAFPKAREVAEAMAENNGVRKARRVISALGDPRLAYQYAEAQEKLGNIDSGADCLTQAIQLSGGDPRDPLSWKPFWMPTSLIKNDDLREVVNCLLSRARRGVH